MTTTFINWLSEEPAPLARLQHDGAFALVGWRDLRKLEHKPFLDIRTLAMLLILAIGLPLIMMG